MEFAQIANLHGNNTCPPITDSSAAALITPDIIKHYTYGNWQGNMEAQDCMSGIFQLLRLDPSISLLHQQEIYQMFYLGEAPKRWKRDHHFLFRNFYQDPHTIPTCCGPCHNGADHFVTFYLCQEYRTILKPLHPIMASYPTLETQLHSALQESFAHRVLPSL